MSLLKVLKKLDQIHKKKNQTFGLLARAQTFLDRTYELWHITGTILVILSIKCYLHSQMSSFAYMFNIGLLICRCIHQIRLSTLIDHHVNIIWCSKLFSSSRVPIKHSKQMFFKIVSLYNTWCSKLFILHLYWTHVFQNSIPL